MLHVHDGKVDFVDATVSEQERFRTSATSVSSLHPTGRRRPGTRPEGNQVLFHSSSYNAVVNVAEGSTMVLSYATKGRSNNE